MAIPLRVLILEDRPADAELMVHELRRAGFEPVWERVETEADYLAHLDPALDIILADYSLPQFDGLRALHLLQERGLDIPFIIVSGAIGEDVAVAAMREGADDYLLKDRLARLGPAVAHALEEKRLRDEKQQADEALRVSAQQWQATFDAISDAVWLADLAGKALKCNKATMDLLEKPLGEIIGRVCYELVHGTSEPIAGCPLVRMRKTHQREGTVLRMGDRWLEVSVDPRLDGDGNLIGAVHILSDITERKRAEEALERSLEETAHGQRLLLALSQVAQSVQRARTPDEVYRAVSDGVAGLGYHAIVLTLTDDRAHMAIPYLTFEPTLLRTVEKLTGLSAQGYRFPLVPGGIFDQIIAGGQTMFFEQIVEPIAESLPRLVRPLAGRLVAMMGLEQGVYAPFRVGGEMCGLLLVTGAGLSEADVPAVTAFANQAAIAIENAQLYQEVERLAITDGLTGVYNHRHFYELLEREVESVKRYDSHLSLIMLDIDGFKAYNDTLGHLAGDALLRKLAQLLTRDTRTVDIVARYGGDEFAILLPHMDKKQVVVLAERLRTSVEEWGFCDQEELPTGKASPSRASLTVTISLGVAGCPEDAMEPQALVNAADMALLEAKKRGGNRVCTCGETA